MKDVEITVLAKDIASVNTALWNVVNIIESVACDLKKIDTEDKEVMIRLAKAYKKIYKEDEEFIDCEHYLSALNFQRFAMFIDEFKEVYDEVR